MNAKIVSFLFILTLLTTGCISEYDAGLPSNDKKILFVDGSITANTDVTFYISESFSLDSPNVPVESFVNSANLIVVGSDGYKSPPAISQGQGNYQLSVGDLADDVEYGIQIEYAGDTYLSTLSKPLYTPEIDSISWTQPDSIGPVFFHISTHDDTGGAKFFMWNYTEDWEIETVYSTVIFYDPQKNIFSVDFSLPYRYCWRKNESNEFLIGSTESLRENRIINKHLYEHRCEDDRFSVLYSVTVNQKAISKGAYEYYQSIKKMNDDMGGLFTPQPSEITGNITCVTNPVKRVLGYVEAAKNKSQNRIFIYPKQLRRPIFYSDCRTLYAENGTLPGADEYLITYWRGYRPSMINMELYDGWGIIVPTEWALSTCTDCRTNGGSKNKPYFWPNSHW